MDELVLGCGVRECPGFPQSEYMYLSISSKDLIPLEGLVVIGLLPDGLVDGGKGNAAREGDELV